MANLAIPPNIDAKQALMMLVQTALANPQAAGPLADAWRPLGLTDPAQAQAFLDNPGAYSNDQLAPFYQAAQALGLLPNATLGDTGGALAGLAPETPEYAAAKGRLSGFMTQPPGIDLPIPPTVGPTPPGGPGSPPVGPPPGPPGFGPFEGLLPSPPVPILGPSTNVGGQLTGPNFFPMSGMVNPIWAAYMAPRAAPPGVPGGASGVPDVSDQIDRMVAIFNNVPFRPTIHRPGEGDEGGEGGGGGGGHDRDPNAPGNGPETGGVGGNTGGPGAGFGGGISGGDTPGAPDPGIGGSVGSEGSPGGGRGDPEAGSPANAQLLQPLFDFGDYQPFGADRGLARGGVVSGPQRRLVGEAGPEAVVPLTDQPGADMGDVRLGDLLAQLAGPRIDYTMQGQPRRRPRPFEGPVPEMPESERTWRNFESDMLGGWPPRPLLSTSPLSEYEAEIAKERSAIDRRKRATYEDQRRGERR